MLSILAIHLTLSMYKCTCIYSVYNRGSQGRLVI